MEFVILKNKTKKPPKMLVFNLEAVIKSERITSYVDVIGKDGKSRKKIINKSIPGSLMLAPGCSSERLPLKYLKSQEIQAAIKAGLLDYEIIKVVEEPVQKIKKVK